MPDFGTLVPHNARVYDYLLGGKDHYAADREAGDRFLASYPDVVHSVRANRAFLALKLPATPNSFLTLRSHRNDGRDRHRPSVKLRLHAATRTTAPRRQAWYAAVRRCLLRYC